MHWNYIAAYSQAVFTGWFALTHWISLSHLNDLREEAFAHERITNFILHGFQLFSIIGFILTIRELMWLGAIFWSVTFLGHLLSWWVPYFWGWPKAFLKNAEKDNKKTYHFLPTRKNHPIPDLNHCIIGVFASIALVTTWIAMSTDR